MTNLTEQLNIFFNSDNIIDADGLYNDKCDYCFNSYICNYDNLKNIASELFYYTKTLIDNFLVDPNTVYVWFKNDYDYNTIVISDIYINNPIFHVSINKTINKFELWSEFNNFKFPILSGNNIENIIPNVIPENWFMKINSENITYVKEWLSMKPDFDKSFNYDIKGFLLSNSGYDNSFMFWGDIPDNEMTFELIDYLPIFSRIDTNTFLNMFF